MTLAIEPAKGAQELALLKAIGFDKLAPEQRELALKIAQRYELDPLLKHLVMIEGRAYITRDGLLHVAHRSGQLDGMEVTEPVVSGDFWHSTCSVYRKDMSRPFTYTGRYPVKGRNATFAPEMAVKVGEVMALRRAFDVAAPVAEERWDVADGAETEASRSAAQPSLAERAAAKAAEAVTDGAIGMPREAFLAALERADITPQEAAERGASLFPGVDPKTYSDAQRADLLLALTEAPSEAMFAEGELEAVMAKIP